MSTMAMRIGWLLAFIMISTTLIGVELEARLILNLVLIRSPVPQLYIQTNGDGNILTLMGKCLIGIIIDRLAPIFLVLV